MNRIWVSHILDDTVAEVLIETEGRVNVKIHKSKKKRRRGYVKTYKADNSPESVYLYADVHSIRVQYGVPPFCEDSKGKEKP